MLQKKRWCTGTDIWLLLLCACLSTLSILTLFALGQVRLHTAHYAVVQLAAACIGLGCAYLISLLDYHTLARLWPYHMALTWGAVALTLLRTGPFGIAPEGTDNFSWIRLPLGMTLQPTEFAKISFILAFALHLSSVRKELNKPKNLLLLLLHLAAPILLVHLQGDDGTALVFGAIGFVMLFAAGLSRIILAFILAAGVSGSIAMWASGYLKSYQMQRIAALLDIANPAYADILYQQVQGRIALGEGGLFGVGLFSTKHTYVPLQRNDFIFTFLGESLGFLGTLGVVVLLVCLLGRILATARKAPDLLGGLICVGIFSILAWQIVVNLGMNLMLTPVIGVTLPFLSAGGTSVVSLYCCMGLVAGVSRCRKAGQTTA